MAVDDFEAAEEIQLADQVREPEPRTGPELLTLPQAFEFTGDDTLRLFYEGPDDFGWVNVHFRMRRQNGSSHATTRTFTVAQLSSPLSTAIDPGVGWLQSLIVTVDGIERIGQAWIRVHVVRGKGDIGVLVGTILQGWCCASHSLGWPGSPIQLARAVDPAPTVVYGEVPLSAGIIEMIVPPGYRWELLTVHAICATSAIAGTRQITLQHHLFSTLTQRVWRSTQLHTMEASQTARYFWTARMAIDTDLDTGQRPAGLPAGYEMPGNSYLTMAINGVQVGDDVSDVILTVRERLEID